MIFTTLSNLFLYQDIIFTISDVISWDVRWGRLPTSTRLIMNGNINIKCPLAV